MTVVQVSPANLECFALHIMVDHLTQLPFTVYGQIHQIVQYLSALHIFETWVKHRHKVLQVHVTRPTIYHAISFQKARTPHALKHDFGSKY